MKSITFNFNTIETIDDFYAKAVKKLQLPDYFGNNLDALWDCVTAHIPLPVKIRFTNMTNRQLEEFENLITLFEDAQTELGDELSFKYKMRKESEED